MKYSAAVASFLTALTPLAFANETKNTPVSKWGPYLAGGYAQSEIGSWELEFGAKFKHRNDISFAIAPLNLVFKEGPPPEGYRTSSFSNGQSRCRNSSTGQFAKDELCEPDMLYEWRGVIEAQKRVSGRVWLGVGAIGVIYSDFEEDESESTYFASLGLEFGNSNANAPKASLHLRGGPDYASAQLRFGL